MSIDGGLFIIRNAAINHNYLCISLTTCWVIKVWILFNRFSVCFLIVDRFLWGHLVGDEKFVAKSFLIIILVRWLYDILFLIISWFFTNSYQSIIVHSKLFPLRKLCLTWGHEALEQFFFPLTPSWNETETVMLTVFVRFAISAKQQKSV